MVTFYQRRLPHWHPPGQDLFLTWRLYGSLPRATSQPKPACSPGEQFVRYDRILDQARIGPRWLKNPCIADCVLNALIEEQRRNRIRLRAYSLLPNHVHLLLTPLVSLDKITQQLKGVTARRANLILSRTGTRFWQDETFDHWVRDPGEWQKIRSYIERNPVAAGLAARPEDWPWCSAANPIP